MRPYSWDDFTADARELVRQLRDTEPPFEVLYAIPRGGLILGTYLSHTLNLPLICGVDVLPESLLRYTLVVDDNTITGESLAPYAAYGHPCAVLVHHPESAVTPAFYARTETDWPIFPWESDSCVALTDAARVIAE